MILLIIIGVVLIIAGFSLKANDNPLSKFSSIFKIFGFVLILLALFSSMFKQIDAGKVGVKSLYGNVQPDVLESGLHIINPLLDVTIFDAQTQNYTMSAIHANHAVVQVNFDTQTFRRMQESAINAFTNIDDRRYTNTSFGQSKHIMPTAIMRRH